MFKANKEGAIQRTVKPDGELIRAVIAGDASAYGELVRRHYNKALAVCFGVTGSREDSEDLVQDVFLNCYKHIAGIVEPEKFSHYLVKAAKNSALNLVKQRDRTRRQHMSALHRFKDDFRFNAGEEEDLPDNEMRESVRRRLQEMSPKIREVVSLYYLDQLRTPQIATLLHIKEAAVRKRLEYGRNALKTAMEREIQPAIQEEKQRKAQIGLILLNIEQLPIPSKMENVEDTPFRPQRTTWRVVAVGTPVLIVIVVLVLVRERLPLDFFSRSFPREPAVSLDSPGRLSLESANSSSPSNTFGLDETQPIQPPSTDSSNPLTLQIGPPPYSLQVEQQSVLKEIATDLTDAYGGDVSIAFPPTSPTHTQVVESAFGDLLLIDYAFSPGGVSLGRLIADQTIIPLTDRVNAPDFEREDFFPNLWPAVMAKGEVWAVPVLVRSWALGVNFNGVELGSTTLASNSWSALVENIATQLYADPRRNGPANDTDFIVPASWVWDCLLLEAGGSYDLPGARNSVAWQRTKQRIIALNSAYPRLLSKAPLTPAAMHFSVAAWVTVGSGDSPSLDSLQRSDPGWGVIAPQRPSSVPHSYFTVASVRRSSPEKEALAWEFIRRLVSRERMQLLVAARAMTPLRESVANSVTDADIQAFTRQIRSMVFPEPGNETALENFADRNREIDEILAVDE